MPMEGSRAVERNSFVKKRSLLEGCLRFEKEKWSKKERK